MKHKRPHTKEDLIPTPADSKCVPAQTTPGAGGEINPLLQELSFKGGRKNTNPLKTKKPNE